MDGLRLSVRKLSNHESTCQTRHALRIDDLDGDIGALSDLQQVAKLFPHNFWAVDAAVEHALVDEDQEHRRIVLVEDALASHAGLDSLFHLVGRARGP